MGVSVSNGLLSASASNYQTSYRWASWDFRDYLGLHGPITITMEEPSHSIRGVVIDANDEQVANAIVVAQHDHYMRNPYVGPWARTGENGEFLLVGLNGSERWFAVWREDIGYVQTSLERNWCDVDSLPRRVVLRQ
jgi:hypothetical protein